MASRVEEPDSELTEFRRDLHAHPELGFQETRTAARVAAALRACGVEVSEGVGGTGLVGTIRGLGPGDGSIGLRADMGCAVARGGDRAALRVAYARLDARMRPRRPLASASSPRRARSVP